MYLSPTNTRTQYNQNPKFCKLCNTIISFEHKINIFCSHSCSAKFNNIRRKQSKSTKEKISKTVSLLAKNKPKFSKISFCEICHTVIRYKQKRVCSKKCQNHLQSTLKIGKKSLLSNDQEWIRKYSLHCTNTKNKNIKTFKQFKYDQMKKYVKEKSNRKSPTPRIQNCCIICQKLCLIGRKTCSIDCFHASREWNCGNSKKFPVTDSNGKLCVLGSPWEKELYDYLIENNIIWIRPSPYKYFLLSENRSANYFCDFYLPTFNLWIDPKNSYVAFLQAEKLEIVSREINLIYGSVAKCISAIKDYYSSQPG
jgi:hypothetical protein